MVVTEVRRYMEAAVEKLTPAKAQEMARSLLQGQEQAKGQVQKVAQDLMDWSNQTRDRISEMVRREVARQLKTMGLVSKDELDALRARVRELERSRGRSSSTSSGVASKSKAKRSRSRTSKAATSKAATSKAGRSSSTAAARTRGAGRPASKGRS
jgi:polyhydroxyalkanoate synthesis regulator phasin